MRRSRGSARCAILGLLLCASAALHAEDAAKRLSETLLLQPGGPDAYPAGVSWRVPGEARAQQELRDELLAELAQQAALRDLEGWVRTLPVTGRVAVASGDARWLATHRKRDPVLGPGDTVVVPRRPRTVNVVTESGERCAVTHEGGREALAYLEACSPARARRADWAWLVQPDGRVERYGIASWNREAQDEPAPGAWIWAPARDLRVPEHLSENLARFLATQGPAPDPAGGAIDLPPSPASLFSQRSRSAAALANDWGETGLLQTPTARMARAGNFGAAITHAWPYTRANVFVQPLDWLEAGYRYTNIANRESISNAGSAQSYNDKSFDAKLRLWRESRYVPEIALGFRDLGGTGLFSGEYLVSNKRFGAFDWSLGIGWGYVGGAGDVRNPLGELSSKFNTRPTDVGEGGNFSFHSYFRGPAAFFGGVQYQTPWAPLVVKLEREGNNYQHEPLDNNLPQSTRWNFGLTYRAATWADLTVALERGDRVLLGLALHAPVSEVYVPKTQDPARVPVATLRPPKAPEWSVTSAEIARQTGWQVRSVQQAGRELRVTLLDAEGIYVAERVDRAVAVLNRDAPPDVDRFTLVYRQRGVELAEHVVERDAWVAEQTRPVPPHERLETVMARPPEPPPATAKAFEQERKRLEAGLGMDIIYQLGTADAFLIYQLSLAERMRYWISDSTWIRAKLRYAFLGNYDELRSVVPSDLPPVRTDARLYATTSRFTMPNLQVTHFGRLTDRQYYSVYGGYLEDMFGGVGGEWLWRPFAGKTALGVDVNYVAQRDFEQDFGFQDYRVTTGHATLYYDTGWNDVLATVSAGRYLAGDKGVTVQLSRVFRNGVTMGAYATRTNVPASQFGEGSFDKGVFLSIPFDAMLPFSSAGVATVLWKPITRDGGAKLLRADTLYDITAVRGGRALWFRPAEKPDAFDIAPAASR